MSEGGALPADLPSGAGRRPAACWRIGTYSLGLHSFERHIEQGGEARAPPSAVTLSFEHQHHRGRCFGRRDATCRRGRAGGYESWPTTRFQPVDARGGRSRAAGRGENALGRRSHCGFYKRAHGSLGSPRE